MTADRSQGSMVMGYLLPALLGIIGVCAGATVTGYFNSRSQHLDFDKSKWIETAAGSREVADKLSSLSADYLSMIVYFANIDATDNPSHDSLAARFQAYEAVSFDLALRVSVPTAARIFENENYVTKILEAVDNKSDVHSARDSLIQGAVAAYVALYGEIAKYRWRATDKAASDELLYSLIQLLGRE